ncbi:hypothetical protein ACWGRK_06230 [Saccharomonospora azurea]
MAETGRIGGSVGEGALRWGALGLALVALVVFFAAQPERPEASFDGGPAANLEGRAGELSDHSVPSVEDMTALVDEQPVVRLPGSIAVWDDEAVREAIGDAGYRILVAPPGLDEDERDRVADVENADITVLGTRVSGGAYQVVGDALADWRDQFAVGDITDELVFLIRALRDLPEQQGASPDFPWREPTAAELDAVVDDLRDTGLHIAAEATLTELPADAAASAFPDTDVLVVALPMQPLGEPVARYGPALTEVFPDTPIVVLYGSWIEYHGPHETEFAEVAATSFYAQFESRLSRYDYPQDNVLYAYLNRVGDLRFSGVFGRPTPQEPFDPMPAALLALPVVFVACVAVFVAVSLRPILGGPSRPRSSTARLAGLTALSIEVSGLSGRESDPALVRGIATLQAAREAVEEGLPDSHVRSLLNDAEREFAAVAAALGRDDYAPNVYLRSRIA